jgi:hypothetical protein
MSTSTEPASGLIGTFQDLAAQVPDVLQPFVVALAGAVPFVEGEGSAVVGLLAGLNPVVAAVAGAAGNFLSVLVVVLLTSRARTAVADRRAGAAGGVALADRPAAPESKGKQRVRAWVVRFGVPGASLLGPLAIPTQITAATLVGSGVRRGWVLLWQAIAIAVWTTGVTLVATGVLSFLAR